MDDEGRMTRAEYFQRIKCPMPMPPTTGCHRLITILAELGYCEAGDMGIRRLSPSTLKDYCEIAEIKLYPEEGRHLLSLSKEYCSITRQYKEDRSKPASYGSEEIEPHLADLRAKKKARNEAIKNASNKK